MTAKIDTQAPDMIHAATARQVDDVVAIIKANLSGPIFDEPEIQADHQQDIRITAKLIVNALTSLSAAREAAAAMAMREAAVEAAWEATSLELAQHGENKIAERIAALPIPTDPTALDRLIAERVREALIEVRNLIAERRNAQEPGPIFGAYNEALGDVEAVRFRRARGSKEGQ